MKKISLIFFLSFLLLSLMKPLIVIAESEVETMFPDTLYSDDLIIADIIIDSDNYDVDPTGYLDSTNGINRAISDCYDSGGGTVFLPAGKYRVSSNITILPFVTLQGDYNDPDNSDFNGDYGTLIYADIEPNTENFPALFTVGGSAGAVGLTIYYPYQTIDNVKPYGFTFEIPSFASIRGHADHMASTIKDITMINSYKGVAASITPSGSLISAANEMIHLENIKGTILYKGFELYNSSEYGVVKNITINNNYWSSAASYLSSPAEEDINSFTKEYGIGMQVGDLEWVVFSNINIQDYCIGLRIYDGLRRLIAGQPEIYFIGQFYNLEIQNTKTALRVDNLYPNFGVNIAKSYLSGEDYSIYRTDETNSVVNLVGTELNGDTHGDNIIISGANEEFISSHFDDTYNRQLNLDSIPREVYNVIEYFADLSGRYDSSLAIQDALDDAHQNGGGIVYLPSGYYKISNALTIYDNTILRGSTNINTRDEIGLSLGTVILSEYGYTLDDSEAQTGQALITVSGDNSGVSGIRIHYPLNLPDYHDGTIRLHTYTIRLMGDNDFVTHVSLAGSTYGIELLGSQDSMLQSPYILGVNGTYYRKGINLKYVNDAYLEELLSNASVVSRNGLSSIFPQYFTNDWPSDANGGLVGVYDNITRPNSYFFTVTSSNNVVIKGSFTYASNTFLTSVNSDILMINNSGDNLYPYGYLLRLDHTDLTAINLMRYSGSPFQSSNSDLTIFNRLSLLENQEKDIYSNTEIDDEILGSSSNSIPDLPENYMYDSSKDPNIEYPITDPNVNPENPSTENTSNTWIYFVVVGGVVFVLGTGIIIIVKKR